MDKGIDDVKLRSYNYNGVYRGTVVYNVDPDVKGKVKIFVHGVYPNEYFTKHEYLPWAEPAMPLFGGSWTNEGADHFGNHLNDEVGWCTVPHAGKAPDTGSQVFLFFEDGDINFPVYFAAVQAGDGWFSEHDNQHVFRSDNVHIRIDLNTVDKETNKKHFDPKSTCKFDSYNQKNSLLSIKDGTKKQTLTRIDIQIQAKLMVAVNLQISGDVNIRQIGDMYVEQEGNRHLTLIGNRYVKHVGNTYIEHEGIYISRQTGAYNQQYIEGEKILDVVGNKTDRTYGNEYKEIQGTYDVNVSYAYTLFVGRKYNITVTLDMNTQVMKNYNLNIIQGADIDIAKNCSVDIGRFNLSQTGMLQITTSNDIQFVSKQGGINLLTLGECELVNEAGAITADGYKNLGLKGNIKLISHMGNIGLETVGDGRFEKEDCVIPWNPVFLGNVQMISMMISDFDPSKALFTNNKFNFSDIGSFLNFITSLPMTAIYDGLPTLLPVKMIAQNPNHDPVEENDWRAGECKNFAKAEDNWFNVTNTGYWKVLGKIIGNIDIRSWSGDINIITEGRLGNAGNINILAEDSVGTLPGYQGGCVNIKSKAKKTVYTDPRNLFFDSAALMNRTNILTNGTGAGGKIMKYLNVVHTEGSAGGCASCIADAALLLVTKVAPVTKSMVNIYAIGIPLHEFNATTHPNTLTYEETSDGIVAGFGHAHKLGMIDDFCTENHGAITIGSDAGLFVSSQNRYTLDTNKMFSDNYHFETTVTPNWKYPNIMYDMTTYLPTNKNGVNLGNKLTLQEIFGNQYSINYTHKQNEKLIYCSPKSSAMVGPNTSTDTDVINYNISIGNKNIQISENYNKGWAYNIIPYLYPDADIKDSLLTPVLQPSPAYTNKYTNNEDYKSTVNRNFTQTLTVSPVSITITNHFDGQENDYYKLAIQEIKVDNVVVGHTVTKDVGCKAISNITTNTQGSNITLNFEASMTDQESHKALILTQQNYESLIYNVDVKAANLKLSYIGTRLIEDNIVTWAVGHLNYTQK